MCPGLDNELYDDKGFTNITEFSQQFYEVDILLPFSTWKKTIA